MVTKQQRMRSIRRLVRMLRGAQRDEKLSNHAMALRLGVSASMLSMVYAGRRCPGRKFLSGVLRVFPQLYSEVYLFLLHERNGLT